MRAFITLWQKELSDIYTTGAAYLLFFIYLLSSAAMAFYFAHYTEMHDASAYALFSLQPYLLAIIVPALTMRTWSEEYRSNTIEWLTTVPLSDTLIVLAKWLGVLANLFIMAFLLLPFILISLFWLHIDCGNILTSYVGLILTMCLFCSVGCFISGLLPSPLKAYLVTAFILIFITLIPYGFFADVYTDFLFAQIGIYDLLYFVLLSFGLLILNISALVYRRSPAAHRLIKFGGFSLLTLSGITGVIAATYFLFPQKADFTSAHIYTLKSPTAEIVQNLNQPLIIDVYVAQDYLRQNMKNQHFFSQISRLLQQYSQLSRGMANVRIFKTEAFSEAENNALEEGLYYEENNLGSLDYFGAIVHDFNGSQYVIQHFVPQRLAYVEKDVDTAILQLIKPQMRKKIGVYLDPRQKLTSLTSLMLNLEYDYNLKTIKEDKYQIPPSLDLLILINPKELPPLFMYALDQYVMRGGKMLVFIDTFTENQSSLTNGKNISLITFLKHWGIELSDILTDSGNLHQPFIQTNLPLILNSASTFDVKKSSLQIEPFITADKGYIGAIVQGELTSNYLKNPFAESNPALSMPPFIAQQNQAQIAIVADTDFLNEENWANPHSADRQQHSLIPTAANGEAVRALVDHMLGNDDYLNLPINMQNNNIFDINQQIYAAAQNHYAEKLSANRQKLNQIRSQLYIFSDNDEDKLQQMQQITAAGQQLALAEKEAETLNYAIKQLYSRHLLYLSLGMIIAYPALILLILWCIRFCYLRRKEQHIKEMFND